MAKNKETVKGRLSATDLVPRIICVLLAIVIWLYVIYNDTPDFEKSFDGVMASITNTAVLTERGLTIYGDATTPVEIVITGRRGDISSYTMSDVAAIVDVSSITEPGEYALAINPEVPEGVTVKSYYPKRVTVQVQQVTEKEVDVLVKPRYTTTLVRGEPVHTVSKVTIKGPASVIDSVSHVEARPAFDEEVTSSITASAVELVACTKSGTVIDSPYLDLTPSEVDVDIPIYDEREIPIKIASLNGYFTDTNAFISVSPSTILLRTKVVGGKSLEGMESIEVAIIDETSLVNSDTVTLDVTLPSGLENVNNIETVKVTVRHRNTVKKVIGISNIVLANPNDVEYTLVSESIDVALRSTIGYSLDIAPEEFVLEGNLADIQNGMVPLTVGVPSKYGNSVYVLGEYFATVEIIEE